MITIEKDKYGYLIVDRESGRYIVSLLETDFPGVPKLFHWSPKMGGKQDCNSRCADTDGTCKCPDCFTSVKEYIESARKYLDSGPDPVEDRKGLLSIFPCF